MVSMVATEVVFALGEYALNSYGAKEDEARIPLYRAVDDKELAFLLSSGNYGHSQNLGGKYFALSKAGAENFAKSPFNSGLKMRVTSTSVPQSVFLKGHSFFDPKGGGASVHFDDATLETLVYKTMTPPVLLDAP